jgi:hypothetical protein
LEEDKSLVEEGTSEQYDRRLVFWEDWCLRVLRNKHVESLLKRLLDRNKVYHDADDSTYVPDISGTELEEIEDEVNSLKLYYSKIKSNLGVRLEIYKGVITSGTIHYFLERVEELFRIVLKKDRFDDICELITVILSLYESLT